MLDAVIFFVLLLLALYVVIKSAGFAIRYAGNLAESLRLPPYVVGFIIVAVISILPEAFIAINSSLQNASAFALGMLFGSNVADLTLVFALVVLFAGRNVKVESKILKNSLLYIGLIILPLIFGLNGYYSNSEGLALVILGLLFYVFIFSQSKHVKTKSSSAGFSFKNIALLLLSMAGLLLGAHFTVEFAIKSAGNFQINPVFIGMFVVGLGTVLPEMFFSIKAARKHYDGLALGDVLGTVIADATVVIGIIAVMRPFYFNPRIIYVTGIFMLLAMMLLMYFMKTNKVIAKKEAWLLIGFYLVFMAIEILINSDVFM